jgi:hypothetical protein
MGAGRMGIIVVVGGAITLLFTLAMFLGSGLIVVLLGYLAYTTLYDFLMS